MTQCSLQSLVAPPKYQEFCVNDGYDFITTVDGDDVIYRPLVGHRRKNVLAYLQYLADDGTQDIDYVTGIVRGQVRYGEYVIDNENLFPLLKEVLWLNNRLLEKRSLQNLVSGVYLELMTPEVATRSCDSCRMWLYDHKHGKVCSDRKGDPIPRPDNYPVPCETSVGCSKGHWKHPIELNIINRKAYDHWLDCKFINRFPDDSIVSRNSRVIHSVYERTGRSL